MRQAIEIVGIANLVLFAVIALVCVRQWRRERAITALWAALAFVALSCVIVVARFVPEDPESLAGKVVQRLDLAILVLFPYLLYRFAVAFEPTSRPLARFIDALSIALVTATVLLPSVPAEGEDWPIWFGAYAFAFLVHWSVLLTIVAMRLWRAGRTEASVARKRMQMLAFAATALTVALVASLAAGDEMSIGALVVALIASLSGVAFLLGFAPPAGLRLLWRRPEQARMQDAIVELMAATSEQDVADRVLPPMARMVGARGIALEARDGTRIGTYGSLDEGDGDTTRWELPFGWLIVRTSAFAPFFGDEERKLLAALGSLTGLGLDRARLFARERDIRESLQRADELKSQFVALAAHELRSPVGTIYGLSETIAERSAQLPPERLAELQASLVVQIRRLRELVEQLLDLSRLDAEAVMIRPQRVRVRDRLEEIVHSVSPLESTSIELEVDPSLEAELDVAALDRIVSNLILNACRYGEPPVLVSAAAEHGTLRVTVQDCGHGVPTDFVPMLFDRFARSAGSAATSPGSGLGLAIARSYARAHHGEVSYRPAAPHGAAFEVVLPAFVAV